MIAAKEFTEFLMRSAERFDKQIMADIKPEGCIGRIERGRWTPLLTKWISEATNDCMMRFNKGWRGKRFPEWPNNYKSVVVNDHERFDRIYPDLLPAWSDDSTCDPN